MITATKENLKLACLALQESLGMVRIAHLKEVGFKFGQWLDVIYLQLMLDGN